jgi:CBS-domain-containing membrane protein
MNSAIQRLQQLCVADVMRREVVEVSANQTMTDAAKKLGEHDISGAPVVDEQGRCVGMLSALDFVRRETKLNSASYLSGCPIQAAEIQHGANESVRAFMSTAVQSVHARVPLIEAARMMCGAHIHRLPVLDARGRAIGMVTSMDLVAAIVHTIDESMEATHERDRTSAIRRGHDSR